MCLALLVAASVGVEIISASPKVATSARTSPAAIAPLPAPPGPCVYTAKMIRAKALTDVARAGYDIEALREAAAHTDTKTTEIYLTQREMQMVDVRLAAPVKKPA